ncbi:MAG TPA: endonuclease/exonuclease/phosphatase family protein [Candidatus Polarisedimenticolaceae bacterium]|nr:endonuclease/exonuclease/phosphatase family protein [Candidatus Polarisedimenticolaceae bacterium]
MTRRISRRALLRGAAGSLLLAASTRAAPREPTEIRVLTFNAWHGLRGAPRLRLDGEDPRRKARRFDWQIEQIRRLDPDLLLLQEVNKNARETRRYADALAYDHINKVTNCGIHLPPVKIPTNFNDGLAILARPGLGLRRVGHKRLSGDAICGESIGFQTRESRFVLFGEIRLGSRTVLVATTHLSAPPPLADPFFARLDRLVAQGRVAHEQRETIARRVDRARRRNLAEVETIVRALDGYRRPKETAGRYRHLVVGGDFNAEPDTAAIATLERAGLRDVSSDRGLLTWDPRRNRENQSIGRRRSPPVPTFGNPAIEALVGDGTGRPRQIDYIFVSSEFTAVSVELALERPLDGLYASDHFGVFSVLRLG